jgi:tRNA A-37 threonylcarbamoyl transferase component Bud32
LQVALHYLHSRGVSHGDVHIENAMVSGSQVICLLIY